MNRWLPLVLFAGCAHSPPVPAGPPFTAHVTGAGRAVVLIPDLGMAPEAWDTTVAHLSARYQVHVLEVAGFAGAPAVAGPLMPQLRDALARYLTEQKLEGAVLVGVLFGATVAYWVAGTEPQLVGGVVAIDTPVSRFNGTIDPEAEEGRDALLHASPERLEKMQRRRYAQLMTDQVRAGLLAGKAARSSPPVLADAFYDSLTRDLRSNITRIRAPVLSLLTTENFPKESWDEIEAIFRAELGPIPRHELVVVPGAHHYVMFDAPEVYFGQLDRFLVSLHR